MTMQLLFVGCHGDASMFRSSVLRRRTPPSLLLRTRFHLPVHPTMKRFPVLVSFLFVLARSSAFTIHPPATALSLSRTALFSSIPEPGPCPSCNDDNAYWDGSSLFVCTACDHEWPVDELQVEEQATEDNLTRDSNGFVLETGDTCVLIKDLAKGKLKKGLKVKIRLGDYGDGHDCQANIADVGTYALKSEFLKKV